MKRRHFLQFASSTLATIGLSQFDIIRQGDRYGRVLAQSTPRKLALLVGINNYPRGIGWDPLQGCVTDVQMQKNLLMYCFGFKEEDILVLTDLESPDRVSRNSILTAFEEHLINQAKPGDVAVFHYSGHGSQVKDPDDLAPDGLNSTFVPIDSPLPSENGGTVNDIMGRSLFLLMSAIKTENLTVVLDSCHSGGGTRGNVTMRSRSGGGEFLPSDEEMAFQEKWISQLDLSRDEIPWDINIAKGVVIASARREQLAADVPFSGFHAGAFTYLMTRYLWQQTRSEPVERAISRVDLSLRRLTNLQSPIRECNPEANCDKPIYFTHSPRPAAEGAISEVLGGDRVKLWLGGVDRWNWEAFGAEAIVSVVDRSGQEVTTSNGDPLFIQLEERNGLVGLGRIVGGGGGNIVQPGAFVQEQIRRLPQDFSLRVGIDDRTFDAESVVAAREAFNAIPRIEVLLLGEGEVQYVFAPMTETIRQQLADDGERPPVGSLGLFNPGLDRSIADSFGPVDESIPEAIARLDTKLQALLALSLFQQVLNADASQLDVEVTMQKEGGIEVDRIITRGGRDSSGTSADRARQIPQFIPGEVVEFAVKNNEADPLYVCVLLVVSDGTIIALFPQDPHAPEETYAVRRGETRTIPDFDLDGFRFRIGQMSGMAEVLVVASRDPLRNALRLLQSFAPRGNRGPVRGSSDIVDEFVKDFDSGTRGRGQSNLPIEVEFGDNYTSIDMTRMAAFLMSFQING
ncbi:MAG: caspase family protein [Cyanobacteriota bacterium]|nr:caspase family protein [Cyanobacteriota bacterium]